MTCRWHYNGPMPLLIDCYNVLHVTMPPSLAGLDEAGLCRALARSGLHGQKMTVVCDGRVKPHGPAESPVDGVDLVYSGPRASADDVIIRLIDADSAPRRLIVVSNDRQIQKAARRRRAKVMPAEELIRLLATSGTARPASGGKPTGALPPDEVERWLVDFGLDGNGDIGGEAHEIE